MTHAQIVSNKNLSSLGSELARTQSIQAKVIYYIQTTVNAKQDTENHCITVRFRAPLDDTSEEDA